MGEERKGHRGKLLLLLILVGAGAFAEYRYNVWETYVKPRLGPPPAGGPAPPMAAGHVVRWTGKIVEVRRPVSEAPSLLVKREDRTIRVDFPVEADAALRRLSRGDEVKFEGTLSGADVVSNAKLIE